MEKVPGKNLFRTLLNQERFKNSLGSGANPSGGWALRLGWIPPRSPGVGARTREGLRLGEGVLQSVPHENGTAQKKRKSFRIEKGK